VDTSVLVDLDLRGGRCVVQELLRSGIPVRAALWNRDPDTGTWRFLLGLDGAADAPLEAYGRVLPLIRELAKRGAIGDTFADVEIVDGDSQLVRDLVAALGIVDSPGIRLRKALHGRSYLDEAIVYRAASGDLSCAPAPAGRGR
jgi:hypothetical protein